MLKLDLAVFENLICKLHQLCSYNLWMMSDIESLITPPINWSQLFLTVDSVATSLYPGVDHYMLSLTYNGFFGQEETDIEPSLYGFIHWSSQCIQQYMTKRGYVHIVAGH